MFKLLAIARNTFLQSVRQPVFGLVVLTTLGSLAIAPAITGWTLDDDDKLLRDLVLSTLLLQGLFLSALGASTVVSGEIEDKTVLTVAAKPVPRFFFILGKFLGVFAALLLAHYLGVVGVVMTLRHGVLQTSAQSSDVSVLIAGPGMMLLVLIVAGVLNYLFDWKFLGTTMALACVGLSLSGFTLLFIDKDGQFRAYECKQSIPGIPKTIDPARDFGGLITYRDATEPGSSEVTGFIIRSEWLGPISDTERAKLLGLSDEERWIKNVNYLVDNTRKLVTPQVLKAALLLVAVLAILTAFAVAASTRLSTAWTLVLTLLLLAGGLVADYYLGELAKSTAWWSMPAQYALRALPDFQFFWLIDAISLDAVIPWRYIGQCFAYAGIYTAGLIAIGAALFETREVG